MGLSSFIRLPLAMISFRSLYSYLLQLKVLHRYEYCRSRFDLKTQLSGALLLLFSFLKLAGITIYCAATFYPRYWAESNPDHIVIECVSDPLLLFLVTEHSITQKATNRQWSWGCYCRIIWSKNASNIFPRGKQCGRKMEKPIWWVGIWSGHTIQCGSGMTAPVFYFYPIFARLSKSSAALLSGQT